MADFTPEYKEVQSGLSFNISPQSIKQPESPKSKEFLFSGLGQELASAGTVVKETEDNIATDAVHAIVDKRQGEEIARRESLLGPVAGVSLGTPTTPAEPGAPASQEQVQATADNAKLLANANASGKLSETYEKMRRDKDVKALRDKLPWMRDIIDEKYERITGEKSGNAYVHAMTTDINAALTAKKEERNKDESFIREHFGSIPHADQWLTGIRNGTVSAAAMYKVALPAIQAEYQLKQHNLQNEVFQGDVKKQQTLDEQAASEYIASKSAATLGTVHTFTAGGTPETIQGWQERTAKQGRVDPAEAAAAANFANTEATKLEAQVAADLSAPRTDAKGNKIPSVYASLGPAKVKELVAGSSQFMKEYVKNITENSAFTATALEHANKAIAQGDLHTVFTGKNVPEQFQQFLRMEQVIRLAGGDQAVEGTMRDYLRTQQGMTPKELGMGMVQTMKLFTNNGNPAVGGAPDPETAPKVLDDQMRAGGAGPAARTKLAVGSIYALQDRTKDIEIRANIVRSMFDENINGGYLSPERFVRDVTNPTTREPRIGRFWLFNQMGSQAAIDSIAEVAAKHPELGQKYMTWMYNEFRNNLFQTEMRTLAQMQTSDNIKIDWNDKEPGFVVRAAMGAIPGKPQITDTTPEALWANPMARGLRAGRVDAQVAQVKDILEDKLNPAITTLARVFKSSGLNPNERILNLFQEQGIDISQMSADNPAVKAAKAMTAKRAKDLEEERAAKEKSAKEGGGGGF